MLNIEENVIGDGRFSWYSVCTAHTKGWQCAHRPQEELDKFILQLRTSLKGESDVFTPHGDSDYFTLRVTWTGTRYARKKGIRSETRFTVYTDAKAICGRHPVRP